MAQWNPPPPTSPHCTLPPSAEDPLDDHTGDNVGDTVFSRSWVLSLLVMVVRSVQGDEMITNDPAMEGVSKGAQRGDDSMNSGKGTMATESEQTSSSYCETVKEPVRSKTSGNILQEREEGEEEGEEKEEEEEEEAISEDLENDLCRLWDVSVNHVCCVQSPVYVYSGPRGSLVAPIPHQFSPRPLPLVPYCMEGRRQNWWSYFGCS